MADTNSQGGISHTPMGHITIRRQENHLPRITMAAQPHPHHLSGSEATYKIPYREVVVVVVLPGASPEHYRGGVPNLTWQMGEVPLPLTETGK